MHRWRSNWSDIRRSMRLEGSFVQNSAWMFTSSGLSILIQFIFFPILSRLYSPEVYGLFGLFNFYSTTLGNMLSLGYNQAFVLPASAREFSALLHLTIRLSALLALLAAAIVLIAGPQLFGIFGHDELGMWIYAVAPVAWLMAMDRITADWAIRNREFRRQTVVSVSVTLLTKLFNTLYGVISATAGGLVWTTILQHLFRGGAYLKWVIHGASACLREKFSWREMRRVALMYKEFPLFIYWGNVLSIFSAALPAALLPALDYGLSSVGFFGYAVMVLDLPVRLMGSGVASVFQQKSAQLVRERPGELGVHTGRLMRNLVGMALVFMLVMWFAGEGLYAFVFGEPWREAGVAAAWLSIGYAFRMVASPLSVLYTTLRREKAFFAFQVALTVFRASSLAAAAWMGFSFMEMMIAFSLVNAVLYGWQIYRIMQMTGINRAK